MALKISEGTRVKVNKVVEVKGNYTVLHLSSSDKRKDEDAYDYSNWGYARLVGKAHSTGVTEGNVLVIKNAKITNVSYKKDDAWVNPPNATLVIFDFDVYRPGNSKTTKSQEIPILPPDDEDSIPF